jgi:hypothetical protein
MEAFLERFSARMEENAMKICANTLSNIANREMKAAAAAMEKHLFSVAEVMMGQVAEEAVERFVHSDAHEHLLVQKRKRFSSPKNKKNHHGQMLEFILEPFQMSKKKVQFFKVRSCGSNDTFYDILTFLSPFSSKRTIEKSVAGCLGLGVSTLTGKNLFDKAYCDIFDDSLVLRQEGVDPMDHDMES